MRLARARKCDRSIRFRRQHSRTAATGLDPDIAPCPHARRMVPDRAALPIAGRGTRNPRMKMRCNGSGRAEARYIRLRIGLRQTVAAAEGSDRRILAGELA